MYATITEKVVGSTNTSERKILADDVNQIREVIQTGEKDLKTNNISLVGNTITADNGANWIRRNGNTFQFYNGSTWVEPSTTTLLTFTAGENIAARDVVYLKVSDGKIYKASTTNSDWIGVATAAITSGASGTIYPNGSLVGGFSGLTPGTWYKVNSTAGTIDESDLTIANVKYNVGVAISATQIILIKNQLNGITNEVNRKGVIHRKVYSSAAEVSNNSGDWVTAKTFNLSAPVNSLIIGINIALQLKNSVSNSYSRVSFGLSGTNLGNYYFISENTYIRYDEDGSPSPTYSIIGSTSQDVLFQAVSNDYMNFSANINKPIKVLDATTTFTIQHTSTTTSFTSYVKDVVVEVIYVENFEEDA